MRKIRPELKRIVQNKKRGASLIFILVVFAILLILGSSFSVLAYRAYNFSYSKMAKQQALNTAKTTLSVLEKEFEKTPNLKAKLIRYLDAALLDNDYKKDGEYTEYFVRIPVRFLIKDPNLSNLSQYESKGKKSFGESYIELKYANKEKTLVDFRIVGVYKDYTDTITMQMSFISNAEKEIDKVLSNSLFLKTPIVNIVGKEIIGDVYIDTPVDYELVKNGEGKYERLAKQSDSNNDKFKNIYSGVYNGKLNLGNFSVPSEAKKGHTKKKDFFDHDINEPNWWTEVYIRQMVLDLKKLKLLQDKDLEPLRRKMKIFSGYDSAGNPRVESTEFFANVNGNIMINSDALIGLHDKGGVPSDPLEEGNKEGREISEHGYGSLNGCSYDYRYGGVSYGQKRRNTYLGIDGDLYVNGNARIENFYQVNTRKNSDGKGSVYVTGSLVIDGSSREWDYKPWKDLEKHVWISGDLYVDGNCYIKNANIGGNVYVSGKICEIENSNIGGNVYVENKRRDNLPSVAIIGDTTSDKTQIENVQKGIVNTGEIHEKEPNYIISDYIRKFPHIGHWADKRENLPKYMEEYNSLAYKQVWNNNGRYYIVKVSQRAHYNINGAKDIRQFSDTQTGDKYYKDDGRLNNDSEEYDQRQIPLTFIRENVNIGGSVKVKTSLILQLSSNLYGDIYCNPTFQKKNGEIVSQTPDKSFCIINARAYFDYYEAKAKSNEETSVFPNALELNKNIYKIHGNIITTANKFAMTNVEVMQREERNSNNDSFKKVGGKITQNILSNSDSKESFFILNNVTKYVEGDIVTNSRIVYFKKNIGISGDSQLSYLNANLYANNVCPNIFSEMSQYSKQKGSLEIENTILSGSIHAGRDTKPGESSKDPTKNTVYLNNSYVKNSILVDGDIKIAKLTSSFIISGDLEATGKIIFENNSPVQIGGSIYSGADIKLSNVKVKTNINSKNKYAIKSLGNIELNDFQTQQGSIIANGDIILKNGNVSKGKVISLFGNVVISSPKEGFEHYIIRFIDEDGTLLYSQTIDAIQNEKIFINEPNFKLYKENKVFLGWVQVSSKYNSNFEEAQNYDFVDGEKTITIDGVTNYNAYKYYLRKDFYKDGTLFDFNREMIDGNINLVAVFGNNLKPKNNNQSLKFNTTYPIQYISEKEENNNSTFKKLQENIINYLPKKIEILMDDGLYHLREVDWVLKNKTINSSTGKVVYEDYTEEELNKKTKINQTYYFLPKDGSLTYDIAYKVSLVNINENLIIKYYSNNGEKFLGSQVVEKATNDEIPLFNGYDAPPISGYKFKGWSKERDSNTVITEKIDTTESEIKLYAVYSQLDDEVTLTKKEVVINSNGDKKDEVVANSDFIYPFYSKTYLNGEEQLDDGFTQNIFVGSGWYTSFEELKEILPERYSLTYKNSEVKNYDIEWEVKDFTNEVGKKYVVYAKNYGYQINDGGIDKNTVIFKFIVNVKNEEDVIRDYNLVSIRDEEGKRRVLISVNKINPIDFTADVLSSKNKGADRLYIQNKTLLVKENGIHWYVLDKEGNKIQEAGKNKVFFSSEIDNINQYSDNVSAEKGRLYFQGSYKTAAPKFENLINHAYTPFKNQEYYKNGNICLKDILPSEVTYQLENGEIHKIENIAEPTLENIKPDFSDDLLRFVLDKIEEAEATTFNPEIPGLYTFRLYKGNQIYKVNDIPITVDVIVKIKNLKEKPYVVNFMSYEKNEENDNVASKIFTSTVNNDKYILDKIDFKLLFRYKNYFSSSSKWYFYKDFKKANEASSLEKYYFDFEKTLIENYNIANGTSFVDLPESVEKEIYLYPEFERYKIFDNPDIKPYPKFTDLKLSGIPGYKYTDYQLVHDTKFNVIQRFIVNMNNGEMIYVDINLLSDLKKQYQTIEGNNDWKNKIINNRKLFNENDSKPAKYKLKISSLDCFDLSKIDNEDLRNEIKEILRKRYLNKEVNISVDNPNAKEKYMLLDGLIAKKDLIINRDVEFDDNNKIKYIDGVPKFNDLVKPDDSAYYLQAKEGEHIYVIASSMSAGENIYVNKARTSASENLDSDVFNSKNGRIVVSNSIIEGDVTSSVEQKFKDGNIDKNFSGISIYNSIVYGNIRANSQIKLLNVSSYTKQENSLNKVSETGEYIDDYEKTQIQKIKNKNNGSIKVESQYDVYVQNNGLPDGIKERGVLLSDILTKGNIYITGNNLVFNNLTGEKGVYIASKGWGHGDEFIYVNGDIKSKGNINIGFDSDLKFENGELKERDLDKKLNVSVFVRGNIYSENDIKLMNTFAGFKFSDERDNVAITDKKDNKIYLQYLDELIKKYVLSNENSKISLLKYYLPKMVLLNKNYGNVVSKKQHGVNYYKNTFLLSENTTKENLNNIDKLKIDGKEFDTFKDGGVIYYEILEHKPEDINNLSDFVLPSIGDENKGYVVGKLYSPSNVVLEKVRVNNLISLQGVKIKDSIVLNISCYQDITIEGNKSKVVSLVGNKGKSYLLNGREFKAKNNRSIEIKDNPTVRLETRKEEKITVNNGVTILEDSIIEGKLKIESGDINYIGELKNKEQDLLTYLSGLGTDSNVYDIISRFLIKINELEVSNYNLEINAPLEINLYKNSNNTKFNSIVAFLNDYNNGDVLGVNIFKYMLFVNGNYTTNKDEFGSESNQYLWNTPAPYVFIKGDFNAYGESKLYTGSIHANNINLNNSRKIGVSMYKGTVEERKYKDSYEQIKHLDLYALNNIYVYTSKEHNKETFLHNVVAKNVNFTPYFSYMIINGAVVAREKLEIDLTNVTKWHKNYRVHPFMVVSEENHKLNEWPNIYGKLYAKKIVGKNINAWTVGPNDGWRLSPPKSHMPFNIYYDDITEFDTSELTKSKYHYVNIYQIENDVDQKLSQVYFGYNKLNDTNNTMSENDFIFNGLNSEEYNEFNTAVFTTSVEQANTVDDNSNFENTYKNELSSLGYNISGSDDEQLKNILNEKLDEFLSNNFNNILTNDKNQNMWYYFDQNMSPQNEIRRIIKTTSNSIYNLSEYGYEKFNITMNKYWLNNTARVRLWESSLEDIVSSELSVNGWDNLMDSSIVNASDQTAQKKKEIIRDTIFEEKLIIPKNSVLYVNTTVRNINLIFKKGLKLEEGAKLLVYGPNQVYTFFKSENNSNEPYVNNPEIHIGKFSNIGNGVIAPGTTKIGSFFVISKSKVTMRIDEGTKSSFVEKSYQTMCNMFVYMPKGYIYYTGNNNIMLKGSYCVGTYLLNGHMVSIISQIGAGLGIQSNDYDVLATYNDLKYLRGDKPIVLNGEKFKFGAEGESGDNSVNEYYKQGNWKLLRYLH